MKIERINDWFARQGRWMVQKRWLVLSLFILVFAIGFTGLRYFKVSASWENYFLEDDPMLAKIQTLILQEEMNLMADPMSIIDVDGSSAIYLIFMVIGIIGYFCVPTVSNWIVQAGGMSSYNRNVNNTASKVTNVAGAAAGASTGNVGAVLLKK